MHTPLSVKLSLSTMVFLSLVQVLPVSAQVAAPNSWETNQQNAINQDAASGAINAGQQAALQNREAQIQAQQQQYMSQNGGTLTQGERHQISSELKGVQNRLNRDVRYDSTHGATGVPVGNPYWQNGQNWQAVQNGQTWQNNNYPQQWQNANPQWQQGNRHHHHGYNNGNGYNNASNYGYGNGWHN